MEVPQAPQGPFASTRAVPHLSQNLCIEGYLGDSSNRSDVRVLLIAVPGCQQDTRVDLDPKDI